jgi:N-acetylgalactosamine-6-sulfatase
MKIHRRDFLKQCALAAGASVLGCSASATAKSSKSSSTDSRKDKPNIVFILADDLGYGDLACYGHPYAHTPELDKLASEGTRFHRFYVTGVTCCPSRTGFMTSRHPAGFPKYMADFGYAGRVTVTELLKKAGYRTGHFGKWHMGPEDRNGTYGIDQIGTIGGTKTNPGGRDAGLFEAAMDFIEANKDVPFYVNVWGHITHYPVDPLPSLAERFKDVIVNRSDFGKHMQEKFDTVERIGGDLNKSMRNYLGDVYSLDIQVGRLLKTLDDLGLRDNTIVVFSSDQGPAPVLTKNKPTDPSLKHNPSRNMLGYAGGLRGGKHTQWEGGVRAPFIVRWPGKVPAGKINRTSVFSGMDWLPTVCSVAGIPITSNSGPISLNRLRTSLKSDTFEGEDVSDIWLGADRSRVDPLFWKASNVNAKISMLSGNWKLHVSGDAVELYNLATDPGETLNVQGKHPEIVSALRKQAALWNATLPTAYTKKK